MGLHEFLGRGDIVTLKKQVIPAQPKQYLKRYQAKWGLIFISPWILGFLAFYAVPFVASFVFSTMDFQMATPENAHFIGPG